MTIEAVLFTEENAAEVQAFIGEAGEAHNGPSFVRIETLEGMLRAVPGEWILKGIRGEFYVVGP